MIWIGYTTLYRTGGPKFARAAHTLAAEKQKTFPLVPIECQAIESKADFVQAMQSIAARGQTLRELHFIGHSGMYGPMFRTSKMPEQFSPHEWRTLALPLNPQTEAYFHACRTARWFAPFFARTFGVTSYGYHGYTTISRDPDKFRWEGLRNNPNQDLYVVACAGKKSHGFLGSLAKYSRLAKTEKMKRFVPTAPTGDTSYNAVAHLYDQVFSDIGVRADEVRWIKKHLPPGRARVLDIGAGNGALLDKLSDIIATGTGVDSSVRMVELANAHARAAQKPHLRFVAIEGPTLPFPDASFDVVISLLSFRYLDWDPMMNEIRRVLAPGGKILIVDMVTVPTRWRELPQLVVHKAGQLRSRLRHPDFHRRLKTMVGDPRWQTMLAYNPIRAEHEFKWYLESRYPGKRTRTLNIGWNARMLAFDSGPLAPGWVAPQSYP